MADNASLTFEDTPETIQHVLLYLCTLLELEDNLVSGANGDFEDRIHWVYKTVDGERVFAAPASIEELDLIQHKLEKKLSAGKDWRASEVNKNIRAMLMPLMSRNLRDMRDKAKERHKRTFTALSAGWVNVLASLKIMQGGLEQEPQYVLSQKRRLDIDHVAEHAKHLLRECKRLKTHKAGKKQKDVVIDLTGEE